MSVTVVTASVTVVTAYYRMKSKFCHEQYLRWMRNFLENSGCKLVIYTDKSNVSLMETMRKDHRDNTRIVVKEFEDLRMYKKMDIWERHLSTLDPERSIHSKELYVIWNEKSEFMKDAIERDYFQSEYYIWMDIGAFRCRENRGDLTLEQIKYWPNEERVKDTFGSRVGFALIRPYFMSVSLDTNGMTTKDLKFGEHVGGLFGGHKTILLEWHRLFYEMLDRYIDHGRFAGKDQNMMANIALVRPDLVKLLTNSCKDPYFCLHHI